MTLFLATILAFSAPGGIPDDAVIQVRVVDIEGKPVARAPVAVRARRQVQRLGPHSLVVLDPLNDLVPTWNGVTDDAGLVSLTAKQIFPPDHYIRAYMAPPPWDRTRVWIGLDIPGRVLDTPVVFGPWGAATGVLTPAGNESAVKLVMPRTGKLAVAIKGEGVPMVEARDDVRPWRTVVATVRDGKAVFSHVPLGGRLMVRALNMDGQYPPGPLAMVDGPFLAGQTVNATVKRGRIYPTLTGRVVDDAGLPVTNTPLIAFVQSKIRYGPYWIRTGADGSFRVILPFEDFKGVVARLEMWEGQPSYRIVITPPPEAKVLHDVAWPPTRDVIKLGDVCLSRLPVAVSGKVVDATGKPMANARVEVVLYIEGNPYPQLHVVNTGADGTFVMRHETIKGEVEARLTDAPDTGRKHAFGTTGVVITRP